MLRFFSAVLPEASRASRFPHSSLGLRALNSSNALPIRQYASQPAPSPAESVSVLFDFSFCMLRQLLTLTHMMFVQATTKMLINGEFRDSETSEWVEVKNPVRT